MKDYNSIKHTLLVFNRKETLVDTIIEQDKEIEKLNKIIGHALGYIECANKVDITYVCKILKGEDKE